MSQILRPGTPRPAGFVTPTDVVVGQVVITGDVPRVVTADTPAGGYAPLADRGGLYEGIAGDPMDDGDLVYWNPASGKFTLTPNGKPFGWAINQAPEGEPVPVIHAPRIAASTVV